MNWTPSVILAVVAGGLAVVSFFKPAWPILAVGVLLIAIAIVVLGK